MVYNKLSFITEDPYLITFQIRIIFGGNFRLVPADMGAVPVRVGGSVKLDIRFDKVPILGII